jgi:aldehyde:ferredoxin oxidoreductase
VTDVNELPSGYLGKVLRIDLTRQKATEEETGVPRLEGFLGGRGLATKILFDETEGNIDPLGPANKLIFATGPLTATRVPTSGRIALAFKSPLTNIIGHCSAGGFFGSSLKMAGLDVLIVEGSSENPCYLVIDGSSYEIKPADELWSLNSHATLRRLKEENPAAGFHFAVIGKAGETTAAFACINFDGGRQAGRCGSGAVMGSKKLKAIVVRGQNRFEVAKPEVLESLSRRMTTRIMENLTELRRHGTSGSISSVNELRALPVSNFQLSYFEAAEQLGSDRIGEKIKAGELKLVSRSCWMCPVGCEKSIRIVSGRHEGDETSIEFESLAMLGPNLGISDLQSVIHFMTLCDDFGIDTVSTGGVIAFAMECFQRGIISRQDADGMELSWGNGIAVEELIRKISLGEGIGGILRQGSLKASKKFAKGAAEYAMQVKGLEIPAWSPAVFRGMGLVYAIGDRGGDHLQAPMMRIEQKSWVLPGLGPVVMDKSASESKGDIATVVQDVKAVIDSLVVCLLPSKLDLDEYSLMLSATIGTEIQPTDLLKIGERVINLSRLFNVREGVSRRDDILPARFFQNQIGKAEKIDFDAMVDQYYRARGWDKEGRPTMRKLVDLNLMEEYRKINYVKAASDGV